MTLDKYEQDVRKMKYIDRKGNVTIEEIGHDKFLRHLYTDWGGKICLKLLIRPFASGLVTAFLKSGVSARMIPGFIKRNRIVMSDYEETVYRSFYEFITRRVHSGARPVAEGTRTLISPCDGKAMVARIDRNARFFIKNREYTVQQLLRSGTLAERYIGGYVVLIRMGIEDCHHYCYAAEGVKSSNVVLGGKLHAVSHTANDQFPVYSENSREYALLQTPQFGTLVMMEVGALLSENVSNLHKGPRKVDKGQEKGCFGFGEAAVVLLIQPDKVRMDYDLIENTENGYETIIRMGERIGEQKLSKRAGKAYRRD